MPGARNKGTLIAGLLAGLLAGAVGGLWLASKLGARTPEITRDQSGRYRDRRGRYVANPRNRQRDGEDSGDNAS